MLDDHQLNDLADRLAERVAERLTMMTPKHLLTRVQLAEALSIGCRSVDRYRANGIFKVVQNGSRPLFDLHQCREALVRRSAQ